MRRPGLKLALLGAVLMGLPAALLAQDKPAGDDAPKDADGQALKATVKEVTGQAQRFVPGGKPPWVALKVKDELDELTVIRTGFRTRVVLAFADRSEVVINRATKMGIAKFRKKGKATRTRLGLKYGSMRASVDRARGPNDFTVKTPVATLAVTGTRWPMGFCGDIGFKAHCDSGAVTIGRGFQMRNLGANEGTNNQMSRYVAMARLRATARLADLFGGLTSSESSILINQGALAVIGTAQRIVERRTPAPLPLPVTTPDPKPIPHDPY